MQQANRWSIVIIAGAVFLMVCLMICTPAMTPSSLTEVLAQEPPEFDYYVFLPIVERPSTPGVHLVNHHVITDMSRYIYGEVWSNVDSDVVVVDIIADLFDEEGKFVYASSVGLYYQHLSPGERRCFDIHTTTSFEWSTYELRAEYHSPYFDDRAPMTVVYDEFIPFPNSSTVYLWRGQLRNDNSFATAPTYDATVYNQNGEVIGCEHIGRLDYLEPGELRYFSETVYIAGEETVDSYSLVIQGYHW